MIHYTSRELLDILYDLHEEGALAACYNLNPLSYADPDDLPPLERALYYWIEAGGPDRSEVTP